MASKTATTTTAAANPLFSAVHDDIIGRDLAFKGPYGMRRVMYCDTAASSRMLASVESFMLASVLPTYCSTHSSASHCGQQTSTLSREAREAVKRSLNCTDEDALIFSGSGSNAAISKLVTILGLSQTSKYSVAAYTGPKSLSCTHPGCSVKLPDAVAFEAHIAVCPGYSKESQHHTRAVGVHLLNHEAARNDEVVAVVFVGPMEHHSNILPWRESSALVIEIDALPSGLIDQDDLKVQLERHAHVPLRIASFTAASNVTGTLEDVDNITVLLHQYGALSFWDYAAAGPHVRINMNPVLDGIDSELLTKDAVFISPHMLTGGPGSPGVLCVKKTLLVNDTPSIPGTALYVSSARHRYLESPEEREEGGTQNILGIIRCGLAFSLKDKVGPIAIQRRGQQLVDKLIGVWTHHPNIKIFGDIKAPRCPVSL